MTKAKAKSKTAVSRISRNTAHASAPAPGAIAAAAAAAAAPDVAVPDLTDPEMHAFIATVPASVVNTCGLVNGMTTAEIYARLKAAHVG